MTPDNKAAEGQVTKEKIEQASKQYAETKWHNPGPNGTNVEHINAKIDFENGATWALSQSPTAEPYGYIFNNRFYESLDDLSGQTMHEGNKPVAVYTSPTATVDELMSDEQILKEKEDKFRNISCEHSWENMGNSTVKCTECKKIEQLI